MTRMRNTIFSYGFALISLFGLSACGGGNGDATVAQDGQARSSLLAETTAVATTWTKCADEYGTCSFSGTMQVRYGLNGQYAIKTATGSIGCNNQVFGDPAPGADKICEYAVPDQTPPPPPPPPPTTTTWTKCADEYGTCSFSGTMQVRYGLNGQYAIKTATGSIGCNNQVFGDPAPGADKICEYAASGSTTPTIPPVVSGSTTMSCIDGPNYQCSGDSILRSDNGVALTSSGVQAYGKSTSDLKNPVPDVTKAYGFTLASGGMAELRLSKDSNGVVSAPAMLLSNLGIFWNGKTERPKIIETFRTTQGRIQLDASGALTAGAVPDSTNLGFYDFANKGPAATQANYANNVYFPRAEPSRCNFQPCPTIETKGLRYQSGNWRTGGTTPDLASIDRVHNDGDIHAGNNVPGSNPPYLPGGNGIGVPFPGSKGVRFLDNWSLQYSNLAAWVTQDTVEIWDWGASNEHNKIRRGIVAFGNVSNPANVPASGTATYSGFVYGWYAANASTTVEPAPFRGAALVTVNFVTREVVVTVQNTVTNDASATSVPVTFKATTAMGATGGNVANYLTGPVDNGTLKGGLSGRYFGPVVTTGTSGAGPSEIGGSFSLSNSTTGQVVVGGFVGRKQ